MVFLIITVLVIIAILLIAIFGKYKLDDEQYDRLKWVVVRWGFLTTFIGVIVKTFDIPYGVETVTIVAAMGALFAGLMGISSSNYEHDGIEQAFNEDLVKDIVGYKEQGMSEVNNIDEEEGGED